MHQKETIADDCIKLKLNLNQLKSLNSTKSSPNLQGLQLGLPQLPCSAHCSAHPAAPPSWSQVLRGRERGRLLARPLGAGLRPRLRGLAKAVARRPW